MTNAVQMIEQFGIPTNNFVDAIRFVNDRDWLSKEEYEQRIEQITGHKIALSDQKQARMYYLYLIQESVRSKDNDVDTVINEVEQRVQHFNKEYGWALVSDEDHKSDEEKVDASGNQKPKKGAKKELAKKVWNQNKDKGYTRKQFIDILVKEVGLTPAGASTYYSNLKAGRY